jgi:hypothetical protein
VHNTRSGRFRRRAGAYTRWIDWRVHLLDRFDDGVHVTLLLIGLVLLPATTPAQVSLPRVVRDSSGRVLPESRSTPPALRSSNEFAG